jgi:alpha-L-rhamnosidase/acyl-CoA thioesterase-1
MNTVKAIVLTLLLSSTQMAWTQTELVKDLNKGKERTLVVYGTSITRLGNGLLWVQNVGDCLNEKYGHRLTLLNKGGSGRNSQWGANNFQDSVLVHRPDAVIIEFSVNDAVDRFDISPEQSVKNTEYMIRKLKEQNVGVEVILLVVASHPVGEAAGKRPNLPEYIDGYRKMAEKHQLQLIDMSPVWEKMIEEQGVKEMQKYLHDGVHSTKNGALKMIAPTVIKALEEGRSKAKN